MTTLKIIHMGSALLSISGFILRGIWMIQGSSLLVSRLSKIAPHIIDSVLLISAVALAIQLQISPLAHGWLMAKIAALPIYIALGMVAFRFGKTQTIKITAWVCAILTFGYIVLAATGKTPSPLFLSG